MLAKVAMVLAAVGGSAAAAAACAHACRVAFFLQGRVVIPGISGILRYLIPTYPPKFRLPTGVDS